MCTCQALIKRALRMLGELPSGREPPANEAAEAMEALQGLYRHLVSIGTLGRLRDVLISANYTAHENERVINTSGGAITITLPTTIDDRNDYGSGTAAPYDYGFVGCGNGVRAPRDRSVVIKAGPTPSVWLYDADLATWVEIDGLVLTDEAPFSQKLETGLAALLANHIVAEYRDTPAPANVLVGSAQCMSALLNRPDSPATVTQSESF